MTCYISYDHDELRLYIFERKTANCGKYFVVVRKKKKKTTPAKVLPFALMFK